MANILSIVKEDWKDKLWCTVAVSKDPSTFEKCEYQDRELVELAVEKSEENLRHVQPKFINQKVCTALVKRNPRVIQFVPEKYQNRAVILDAINFDPLLIAHVKKQVEAYQLKAVNKCADALAHCDKPTKRVINTAIRKDGDAIRHVMTLFRCYLNDNKNEHLKKIFAGNSLADFCMLAVQNNGMALRHIIHYFSSRDVVLAAIRQNPKSLMFIPKDAEYRLLFEREAMSLDPSCIVYVVEPTPEDIMRAFEKDEKTILKFRGSNLRKAISLIPPSKLSTVMKFRLFIRKIGFISYIELVILSALLAVAVNLLYHLATN